MATWRGKTPLPATRPRLLTLAPDDAALGLLDEADQPIHLGNAAILGESFVDGFLPRQFGEEQFAHRIFDCRNLFRAEAAALKSDLVDSNEPRPVPRSEERRVGKE